MSRPQTSSKYAVMALLPCRLRGLLGGLSRSITRRTASSGYRPARAGALRPSIARLSPATVTGFDLGLDFDLALDFAISPLLRSPLEAMPELLEWYAES